MQRRGRGLRWVSFRGEARCYEHLGPGKLGLARGRDAQGEGSGLERAMPVPELRGSCPWCACFPAKYRVSV